MEMTSMAPPHHQESSSPNSNNGSSIVSTTSTISNNNGTLTPPLTPKTLSRSEANNPYPTTFVQADTGTFKQVVQMLTGSSETTKNAASKPSGSDPSPPPSSSSAAAKPFCGGGGIPPKKEGFKLYKRRNSLKNNELMISPTLIPGGSAGFSPRKPEILSPSILDFPSLVLSPVTPLTEDPFYKSSEEEKAIAEKKFYLHPSPRANAAATPVGDSDPPQLLPLFPVSSPGAAD